MRTTQTVEENGYFMTFVSDDGDNAFIGESYNREQSVKEANELADMFATA